MRYLWIAIAAVSIVVVIACAVTTTPANSDNSVKKFKLITMLETRQEMNRIKSVDFELYAWKQGKWELVTPEQNPGEICPIEDWEDHRTFQVWTCQGSNCIYYTIGGVLKKYCY